MYSCGVYSLYEGSILVGVSVWPSIMTRLHLLTPPTSPLRLWLASSNWRHRSFASHLFKSPRPSELLIANFSCEYFDSGVWISFGNLMWGWMKTYKLKWKIRNQTAAGEGEIIAWGCKWDITGAVCYCYRLWGNPWNSCQTFKEVQFSKTTGFITCWVFLNRLKILPTVVLGLLRDLSPLCRKIKMKLWKHLWATRSSQAVLFWLKYE